MKLLLISETLEGQKTHAHRRDYSRPPRPIPLSSRILPNAILWEILDGEIKRSMEKNESYLNAIEAADQEEAADLAMFDDSKTAILARRYETAAERASPVEERPVKAPKRACEPPCSSSTRPWITKRSQFRTCWK
ncbi:MAG: hypothetical protein NVSMB9_31960 [Isosphaeraceae bacterium]